MSLLLAQQEALDYVPKYLFLSTNGVQEACKSRHVMREFLRKRDSIRRQKRSSAKAQSRVFPWLRREDTQQPLVDGIDSAVSLEAIGDSPSPPPYATSSRATTPQHSQWTSGTSTPDPLEGTLTTLSTLSTSHSTEVFPQDAHRGLIDYMNRVLICRLNETSLENNHLSPATVLNNHTLMRPLPAKFLRATISLSRDSESGTGPGRPSSGTLSLLLDGLGSLKEQIQTPGIISDDSILAVINLWIYEATLLMDITSVQTSKSASKPQQPVSATDQTKIQAHIDGLQRLIACHGGLHNLSAECEWALAWCVSTMPGYFPTPSKLAPPISSSRRSLAAADESQGARSRLLAKLARIKKLLAAVNFQCTFLNQADFLPLKVVLYRLGTMLQSRRCQKTPLQKLTRAASTISILLFILDIMFGSLEDLAVVREPSPISRPHELLKVQQRLISQRLDQEGSFEKVWQVLMVQDEPTTTTLRLHPRVWPIAETTNILKHLNLTTLNSLSKMLMSFLLPSSGGLVGEYGFEKILSQIRAELEGISSIS